MKSENKLNTVSRKELFEHLNEVASCEVSKASVEIMLERFYNGKEIDFPFTQ